MCVICIAIIYWLSMWHVGNCGVCVVGQKDIGMGIHKCTVMSFVPTLFGCFLGIPSIIMYFYLKKKVFRVLFQLFFCFFGGGGGGGCRVSY